MQEFSYLPSKCTDQSLYERLRQQVRKVYEQRERLTYMVEVRACPTLPESCLKDLKIPMECRNTPMLTCLNNLSKMAIRTLKSLSDETSKSCKIKEYLRAGDVTQIQRGSARPDFTMTYGMQSPLSLHQLSGRILKTLKKEYYIIDDISAIGTIGGTLGLFIGISFLNIITWAMDLFCNNARGHL